MKDLNPRHLGNEAHTLLISYKPPSVYGQGVDKKVILEQLNGTKRLIAPKSPYLKTLVEESDREAERSFMRMLSNRDKFLSGHFQPPFMRTRTAS